MRQPYKRSSLYLVVLITLLGALLFPMGVRADDGTPPPDSPAVEAPAADATDAASADAPSVAAQDANPTDPAATEAPSVAPADTNSTDAAATEAPSAAPADTNPTDAAVTEVPSVAPADTNPTDEAVTEAVATAAPSEDPNAAPTDGAIELADAVSAIADAGAVLTDGNGEAVPLASQQAADALLAGDPMGCPAGHAPVSWGGDGAGCTSAYTSIQAAINDVLVVGGWTVYIDAGTYAENVAVNKSVTLQGKGQGLTIVVPGTSDPNTGCFGVCATATDTVVMVQADNVTLRDLTIDGDNSLLSGVNVGGANIDAHNGIYNSGHSNMTIQDVTVQNVYERGIQSSGGSFSVTDSTVSNVQGNAYSIAVFNSGGSGTISGNHVSDASDAISANWSTGTSFLNNVVTNSGSGVHTDNAQAADVIQGNTISNGPANSYGIFVFAPYAGVSVSNNTISNVDYGLTLAGSGSGVPTQAISFNNNVVSANVADAYVTSDVWGYFKSDTTANFTGNVFSGGQYGFYIESQGSSDTPAGYTSQCTGNCVVNITAFDNSLSGQTLDAVFFATGLVPWNATLPDYNGTYNVNASGNWWGSSSPSVIAGLFNGSVDYTPWLNSGIDSDPVTMGFQGDFSSLTVDDNSAQTGATGRVQEGVNMVAAGGTVDLAPGTYTEQVVINGKNLTLQGDPAGSILRAPTTVPLCFSTSYQHHPVLCVQNTANVFVSGLTVDGAGLGNANNRLEGIGLYNSGGTIEGNTIEHVRNNPLDGIQAGTGLYAYNADGTPRTLNVIDNTVFDYQKTGIVLNGTGLNVNVTGNSVTGAGPISFNAQNGIQIGYGATGSVSGNTISNHYWTTGTYADYGGLDCTDGNPTSDPCADGAAGILLYEAGAVSLQNNVFSGNQFGVWSVGSAGTTITGNTFQGASGTGVAIWDSDQWSGAQFPTSATLTNNTFSGLNYGLLVRDYTAGGDLPAVTAHQNNFAGNTTGVWANALVNATQNWWGSNAGPLDGSGGTDACGVSLFNPFGGGSPVSPCVLYDPWSVVAAAQAASAASGAGGAGPAAGGNAIITVTGGQQVTLSCASGGVTLQIGDIQVSFTGLCGYDVILDQILDGSLPGSLGEGNTFEDGVSVTVLQGGQKLEQLPAEANIRISYEKPASGEIAFLAWNGNEWIEHPAVVLDERVAADFNSSVSVALVRR